MLNQDLKQKLKRISEYGKGLIMPNISPFDILCKVTEIANGSDQIRINNFKAVNEMTFVAYLVKVFFRNSQNSEIGSPVDSAILLSSDLDIICLQIHDANFYSRQSFPEESNKVICENIVF